VDIGEDPQASNWSDFVPLNKHAFFLGAQLVVSSDAGGTPLMSKFIAAGYIALFFAIYGTSRTWSNHGVHAPGGEPIAN
jgi:hypothetical protein